MRPHPAIRMALTIAIAAAAAPAAGPRAADDFFRADELGPTLALSGRQYYIPTVFGPTGMNGWILDDTLVVREVEPGSPADGIARPNDTIIEVNGKALGGEPLKTLGIEVEQSEQTGKMDLTVLRAGKKTRFTLRIRKLGAFGKDWPYQDAKSRAVLIDACDYLARVQNADGSFDTQVYVGCALDGLVWLATQDPAYWENARRLAYHYRTVFDPDAYGTVNWDFAYMGVFIAEYYLQTGDRNVLGLLRQISQVLARNQQASGTWGHGPHPGLGYVQGGSLNNCGLVCWMALELIKETGTPVSEPALRRATKFFSRFVDRGTTPYGDHRPEYLGGNGKNAIAGVALSLLADQAGSEYFARMVCDTFRSRNTGHTGGFFGFVWGNVQGARHPHYPDYRRMLDHWSWLMNVSRTWDGGFLLPASVIDAQYTYRGTPLSTGGCGLLYAMPSRALRIFGAPKGVFATRFADLPEKVRKGMGSFRTRDLGRLRKIVKPKCDLSRELLAIAARAEKDIALTLKKIDAALADENPALARRMALDLDTYTGGLDPRMRSVIARATPAEDSPILAAGKVYDTFKWLTYTLPEARRRFEEIARDPNAGIYRRLARRELATPPDSPQWVFYGEMMYDKHFDGWQLDEKSRAAVLRVASIRGGNWTKVVATTELYRTGLAAERLAGWAPLVGPCTEGYPGKAPAWRRLSVAAGGQPPEGWAEVDFDDEDWQTGRGPFTYQSDEGMRTQRMQLYCLRIPFQCKRTDYKQLQMGFRVEGRIAKAACYLNGKPVLWAQRTRPPLMQGSGLTFITLPDEALKLLRKGPNVLAVRTYIEDGDFSLYASGAGAEKSFTPRPKDWRTGPRIDAPELKGKTAARVDVKSTLKASPTHLTFDPQGKPNEDYDVLREMLSDRTAPIAERARYLGHFDPRIRLFASLSLMVEGQKAMPHILDALESGDVWVIRGGCDAIAGRFGFNGRNRAKMRTIMTSEVAAPAAPKLVKLLDHPDPWIREGALLALSNCGAAAAKHAERIAALAADREWWVRAAVGEVMKYVEPMRVEKATTKLVRGFARESSVYGRNRLRDGLVATAKRGEGVDEIVAALVAQLNGPEDYGSQMAADALGRIGPDAKSAVPALEKKLDQAKNEAKDARSPRARQQAEARARKYETALTRIKG